MIFPSSAISRSPTIRRSTPSGQLSSDRINLFPGLAHQITDVIHLGGVGKEVFQKLNASFGDEHILEHFPLTIPIFSQNAILLYSNCNSPLSPLFIKERGTSYQPSHL